MGPSNRDIIILNIKKLQRRAVHFIANLKGRRKVTETFKNFFLSHKKMDQINSLSHQITNI